MSAIPPLVADPIAIIDAALGGAATALLLLEAVILFRAPRSRAGKTGAWLAVCGMVTALGSLPGVSSLIAVTALTAITATVAVPLFWIFARSWFDDNYRPGWNDVVLSVAYLGIGVAILVVRERSVPPISLLDFIYYAGGTGFAVHAQWSAWRNRKADLVESRRRARLAFVFVVAAIILWLTWGEFAGRLTGAVTIWNMTDALILFTGAFWLAILLTNLRPEMFPPTNDTIISPCDHEPVMIEPIVAMIDTDEEMLAARLQRLMSEDRAYRDPELTIGAIAARLDAQEYKLRRLINGCLGHRNVNAYLNGFRLREVGDALADPEQAEVPIVTIALDAGFGSLGVFNRTFKEVMAETPSAYRRRHMEGSSPTSVTA